ncbi:hypothetical protein TB2_014102 [Malus domestica]
MKEVVLAMQARINLGVGGGSRDQLAELYSLCDDQTMKIRLSSDKVTDNIHSPDKKGRCRKEKASTFDFVDHQRRWPPTMKFSS